MFARISTGFVAGFLLVALGGVLQVTADTEANKALVRRQFEEVYNQGNLDFIDEFMAPDYTYPMDDPNPLYHSSEEYKQHVVESRAMFPDGRLIAEDQVAEGDRIATRWTAVLTPQVTMMGILFTFFADGKIAGDWENYDQLGLMQQLGAIPSMPEVSIPALNRKPEDYLWGESSAVAGDPGDPEANKAMVRREFEEIWRQGNLDLVDELFASDFAYHDPVWPNIRDLAGYKQFLIEGRNVSPDQHVTIDDMIAEGDKVAFRSVFHGTDAATGKQLTVPGIAVYRFADGKIVEAWWAKDFLGLMQQFGVIPPPEPTAVESPTWGQVKSLFQE